uniref:FAM234A/B beta-propeller domain-containing protein n=1 Tax=Photinus pyralis TaxID=7054 RepID=A0A1Y1L8D8_PHOPY
MATYPGMNLRGEVRESVSLDEDDLSDVEDEVFIRDGKSGYKFEDMSVKKPLMAPRRKTGRSDLGARIKNRPHCKSICKICCYAFIALSVLVGLIILVIILVSLFPIPLDKLKLWIVSNTSSDSIQLVPCSDFRVTDVWSATFPNFMSESSVQILDVNQDEVDDVIFGFRTGEDNTLPQELYCATFFGVTPPCSGGILALNGTNGSTLWRTWVNQSVFTVICTTDINADNVSDCLITGKGGIFFMLDPRNGSIIWEFLDQTKDVKLVMDIYWANFIPDQDGDRIPDILVSHTSQKGRFRLGHLLLISGKTGSQIQKIATAIEIYYTPQLVKQANGNYSVLFGTGSPTVPGNLTVVSLDEFKAGSIIPKTIYQDRFKGVLSPGVLVDITGDGVLDVVCAMFNTTVVAIDGNNYTQIWNFTVPSSQTLSIPTPGYFNGDNVTDFLIKYQTGSDFPTYYYSQTFILNGKTGLPFYKSPVFDSVGSQMGGLTLGMESYGLDAFVYWIADCKNFEGRQSMFEFIPGSSIHQQSHADLCKLRFNSTMSTKLYALNQFDQPPGIELYSSEDRAGLEYNNSKLPMDVIRLYLDRHPEVQFQLPDSAEGDDYDQGPVGTATNVKYKDGSSFRHKDNGQGLIRDFSRAENKRRKSSDQKQPKFDLDYDSPESWQSRISTFPIDDLGGDYNTYLDEDASSAYNNKKLVAPAANNRDPRSKFATTPSPTSTATYGIYDYKNIEKAHTRLLHDLNDLPSDILKDTYFKNREHQLRKSRFEQRDLKSHEERIRESADVHRIIEEEKKSARSALETLWDLESEKEKQERDDGNWRSKRDANYSFTGIPRLTSVGALASPFNSSKNSIDLILVTYWINPKKGAQVLLEEDFRCINEKLASKENVQPLDKEVLEEMLMEECLEKRGVFLKIRTNDNNLSSDLKNFPYYHQVSRLGFGQMTVYRLQIRCMCEAKQGSRCARFLPLQEQPWPSYLGRSGDGVFTTRN